MLKFSNTSAIATFYFEMNRFIKLSAISSISAPFCVIISVYIFVWAPTAIDVIFLLSSVIQSHLKGGENMTKAELAPYLSAVTNDEELFLLHY